MINDETLTLYYYADGLSDAEREQVTSAIAQDAALARRYDDLVAELELLTADPEPEAPAKAVVRWRYELDKVIAMRTRRSRLGPLTWLIPAAAVLLLGIAIGMNLSHRQVTQVATPIAATQTTPPPVEVTPTHGKPSLALTRGVTAYMRESRLQLVGLTSADTDNRIELITQIIEQNRLFERAADANDASELARVLRAFEQMLFELARQEAAPKDITQKSNQLSFEYAVMLTKLTRDASQPQTSL